MVDPEFTKHLTSEGGLANRLKAARGAMLARELAAATGWQPSKISKIEAGKQLPTPADLAEWAKHTGMDERLYEQLKVMLDEALALRIDYSQRYRHGQTGVQQEYNDLAQQTKSFRFFETAVVPRYLQVPEYTRALLQEFRPYASVDDVDEATRERQKSVDYLYTDRQFAFLLDEPVLRRKSVPPEVMHDQLDRLMAVIGRRNIRLGIYPSLSQRVQRTPINGFELFDDIGYSETWIGEGPRLLVDAVSKYDEVLDQLWQEAAEGDAARELINKAIAELRTD
jgi:transcriptional regulator with XRE-family HTH domain